jgi:hypothetical protein
VAVGYRLVMDDMDEKARRAEPFQTLMARDIDIDSG